MDSESCCTGYSYPAVSECKDSSSCLSELAEKLLYGMLKDVYHPPVVEAFKKYVIEQAQKEWDYKTS